MSKFIDKKLMELRQKAQTALENNALILNELPAAQITDVERLLEEVRIYQAELEIQNEELRDAQLKSELALEQYKQLFTALPVAAVVVDSFGVIEEGNQQAAALFGFSSLSHLHRHSFYRLLDSQQDASRFHIALQRENADKSLVLEGIRTKHLIPVSVHIVHLATDDYHRTQRKLVLLVDRSAEEDKKRYTAQANHLQAIFDSSSECIKLSNRDGIVLTMNPAGLVLIEADSEETVRNQSVYPIIAPEYREQFQVFNETVCNGYAGSLEFEIIGLRGTRRWMETQAVPFVMENGETVQLAFSHDITQRKQMEKLLLDHKIFISSILDSLKDHIAVVDEHGVIIAVNQAWRDFAEKNGLPPDCQSALGQSYFAVCDTADNTTESDFIASEIKKVLTGVKPEFFFEYPCHSPTEQRWFFMRVTPLRGSKQGVVISHENITQRKQVENLVDTYWERLQIATDAAQIGVWDWNIRENDLFWGDKIYDIYGVSQGSFKGGVSEWSNYIHPDDRSRVIDRLQAALRGECEYDAEFRIIWPDGSIHDIKANSKLFFDENHKPIRMVGTNIEITERKQAELKNLALIQRNQVLMDNAIEGIHILDNKGNVLQANKAFCRLLGYSQEESLKLHVTDWDAEFTQNEIQTRIKQLLTGQAIFETLHRRKDGSIIHVEVSAVGVTLDGQLCIYASSKDITERKQVEQQLQQAKQTAERANQAKSEFLANMSHEIRTPMNAILGFSEILDDLITDNKLRHYLKAIQTSGKTLLHLINDILDLSKIEAGKLELHYEPQAIHSIFNDIELVFSQKIAEKGLHFNTAVSQKIPPQLMVDEVRIRQILLNLISNAVKFTPQGSIAVTAVGQPVPDSDYAELTLSVIDTGVGIAEDQLERIFESFSQQKNQSSKYGGTGLGLTICKRLVDMMGGSISVRSEVGQGSCFRIFLPQVEICHPDTVQTFTQTDLTYETVHFQPAKLLLVDDVEVNRTLIKAYLEIYAELQVVEAESGKQTLELVKSHQFDLILIDKKLPDADGDLVCEKIRALPAYASVPIIMVTASVLSNTAQIEQAAYDLQLHKPIGKTELIKALQTFLSVKEQVQQEAPKPIKHTLYTSALTQEQQLKLNQLLTEHYQAEIKRLNKRGALKIDAIIDIAEELITLAQEYQHQLLLEWAQNLKTQAELFDLALLPKTLTAFDDLLAKLQKVS